MRPILKINASKIVGPYLLALSFSDGVEKVVNVKPLLEGPIFTPLHDLTFFKQAYLDPICGTVVWPNGADFAPEALHELEDETSRVHQLSST